MGNRILVIDDEEEVLKPIVRILERMGHQAVGFQGGETALRSMDLVEYDLIVSDFRMAGMGGPELYQHVRKRWPELADRIIFTTGDTVSHSTRSFLQNVAIPSVTKPFMIEDLQEAIEEVLEGVAHGR
jgi:two-component system NtrC family sensor kinase